MRVLAAGDHFVSPDLLVAAMEEEIRADHLPSPEATRLQLPWPVEPFGPVGGVEEASGTEDEIIEQLRGAEICMTQMAPVTATVLDACPDLRLVSVCRGGPINVDLEAATRAGVTVTYAPGRNATAAAEYTIAMILAALRRVPAADAELHAGRWRGDYYAYDQAGVELRGTVVGLVGYGAIGRMVARILRAFDAEVLVSDPYTDQQIAAEDGVRLVGLEELLSSCTVVSLHARLTAETRNLISAEQLALLPRGAVLVNTARGGLLDYAPLPGALRSGQLGALALDVYDVEPPPADWPLRDLPNVVTTPHLAGATRQTAERAARIVATEVGRYLRGDELRHPANPEVREVRT